MPTSPPSASERPSIGRLTLLYVCALGAIAVLVVLGQVLIQQLIESHSYDSRLINMAGRQRMLSQRIAKCALAVSSAPTDAARDAYRAELANAIGEWSEAHHTIRTRSTSGFGADAESTSLFEKTEPHFEAIVAAAGSMSNDDAADYGGPLTQILEHEPLFLATMERAVAQVEAEASGRVARLRRTEMALAGLVLLALLVIALCVFRPAAVNIRRSFARLSQSELQRQRMAEELSTIFDSVPALILYYDRGGRIVRVNRSGAEILGASMYRLERSSIYELFPGNEAQSRDEDTRLYASGEPLLGLLRVIRNYEGDMRWLRMNKVPYRDLTSDIAGIILFGVDVSAHKRLELRLMELTAEAERRLGYDLHDGLGQHLSGILYLSKRLQARLAQKQADEESQAAEILSLVKEAVNTVRDMSKGLRPLGDQPSDLSHALADLAAATESTTGIRCTFEEASPVLIFSPATSEHLYRIAQEALNNAVRHSQATSVSVRLEQGDEVTRLTIVDDGVGFVVAKAKGPRADGEQSGMGLSIMEHRTQLLGGQFSIESAPGAGTRVRCEVDV